MQILLQKEFGFKVLNITQLNGYDNLNFLVETADNKYIFKTYLNLNESNVVAIVKAEIKTLLLLQKTAPTLFPKPIKFTEGTYVKLLNIDGTLTHCRMLSFLEGELMGNIAHTKDLFSSLGAFIAQLDVRFQNHNNPVIKERQWVWHINNFSDNKRYLKDIPIAEDRALVSHFFKEFEVKALPVLSTLRHSIIHNDANDWNTLVTTGKVSGLIDFGDLAYAPLINELAVAICYACFDKDEPLPWATAILKAYHEVLPLQEKEIAVLYYLIIARLCVSICNAAYSKIATPQNTYAFVTEKPAIESLYTWFKITPNVARNYFRKAIGLGEIYSQNN